MDNRLFDAGASATPPTAPAAPSAGYPSNGDPLAPVPPTYPGAFWFHQIGEELRAVLTAASVTPDEASLTQVLAALRSAKLGLANHGQCVLTKSGANLLLSPLNGNKLIINGSVETIPAAGVTLAPPATDGVLYYIYAYMNAGEMTLEAVATGHSTDANTGVEIKTGDATRTLVGMARTVSSAWVNTASQRFVRSWFNDIGLQGNRNLQSDRSTASTTYTETSTQDRAEFLVWSHDLLRAGFSAATANSVAGAGGSSYASIYLDGATPYAYGLAVNGVAGLHSALVVAPASVFGLVEGYHYLSPFIKVSGGTMTCLSSYADLSYWS